LERRKRVRAVDGGAGAGSGELGRAATALLAWDLDNVQLRGPTEHAHATLQLLREVAVALQELGGDPPRWVRLAYANGDTLAQPWMYTDGAALLTQYGWQLREVATVAQAADQALHGEVRAALQHESVAMLMLLWADVGFAPLVTAAGHQGVRSPSNEALRRDVRLDVFCGAGCHHNCMSTSRCAVSGRAVPQVRTVVMLPVHVCAGRMLKLQTGCQRLAHAADACVALHPPSAQLVGAALLGGDDQWRQRVRRLPQLIATPPANPRWLPPFRA